MNQKNNYFASLPVFLAFLCMGFGDVVGPLTGLIKQEFQLSNIMARMIPFVGFLMYLGFFNTPGKFTLYFNNIIRKTQGINFRLS